MKNKQYITGIATVLVITLGCLFKIAHWPFAGILLILGLLILSLVFIPMAFVNSYKAETNPKLKPLYILTPIVFSVISLSALFKIMHWPYASLLLNISIPLPFVLLLPLLLWQYKNDNEINYKNFMPIMFFFAYMAAISALLAMGPSKNLVHELIVSNEQNIEQTDVLTSVCEQKYTNVLADSLIGEKEKQLLRQIHSESRKIMAMIDEIKLEVADIPQSEGTGALKKNTMTHADATVSANPEKVTVLVKALKHYKSILANMQQIKNQESPKLDLAINTALNIENCSFQNEMRISIIGSLSLLEFQVQLWEYLCLAQ